LGGRPLDTLHASRGPCARVEAGHGSARCPAPSRRSPWRESCPSQRLRPLGDRGFERTAASRWDIGRFGGGAWSCLPRPPGSRVSDPRFESKTRSAPYDVRGDTAHL